MARCRPLVSSPDLASIDSRLWRAASLFMRLRYAHRIVSNLDVAETAVLATVQHAKAHLNTAVAAGIDLCMRDWPIVGSHHNTILSGSTKTAKMDAERRLDDMGDAQAKMSTALFLRRTMLLTVLVPGRRHFPALPSDAFGRQCTASRPDLPRVASVAPRGHRWRAIAG